MAKLLIERDGHSKTYEILEDALTLGRDPTNQIRLSDPAVSRHHCKVEAAGGGYRVVDLESTIGILVNGRQVKVCDLVHGDELQIGTHVLKFLEDEADTAARPAHVKVTAPVPVPPSAQVRAPAQVPPPVPVAGSSVGGALPRRVQNPKGRDARPAVAGDRGTDAAREAAEKFAARGGHIRHDVESTRRVRELRKSKGVPTWVILCVSGVVLLVVALVVLSKTKGTPLDEKSPQGLYSLASDVWQRGQDQQALDYVKLALSKGPDRDLQQSLRELQARIERGIRRAEDRARIDPGRDDANWLTAYEEQNVAKKKDQRACARVLVRAAKDWIVSNEALFLKYEDLAPDVARVKALIVKYEPVARLSEPDTADDVIAQAVQNHANLRFGKAQSLLSAWIAANPGAPGVEKVQDRLEFCAKDANAEMDRQMARADDEMKMGKWVDVKRRLTTMIERTGIGERVDAARAKLREVEERERAAGR